MKKSLLLMAMLFAVSSGFAQAPAKAAKGAMVQMPESQIRRDRRSDSTTAAPTI